MTDVVRDIIAAQSEAAKRGVLTIWTIYDKPKDYPTGHFARCFESGRHGSKPTDRILAGTLEEIRHAFAAAGLVCVGRHQEDEPHVVESWL